MARITNVKAAQQRYETVPVIDPETGMQKVTPVMNSKGEQKVTKSGRAVVRRITVEDKTKPKPLLTCDYCRKDIEIGTPYKHISPKSGPYGGRQLNRHGDCPSWNVWEYSSSLSARLAQIAHDFWGQVDNASDPDEVQSALDSAADSIEEIAEEKRESASNIEDGFGHSVSSSEELESVAVELEGWADEVRGADIPEFPEPEAESRFYIVNPDGTDVLDERPEGFEDESEAQAEIDALVANGDAVEDELSIEERDYEPDEPTEEQVDEWRDEVRDAVSIVDESPV